MLLRGSTWYSSGNSLLVGFATSLSLPSIELLKSGSPISMQVMIFRNVIPKVSAPYVQIRAPTCSLLFCSTSTTLPTRAVSSHALKRVQVLIPRTLGVFPDSQFLFIAAICFYNKYCSHSQDIPSISPQQKLSRKKTSNTVFGPAQYYSPKHDDLLFKNINIPTWAYPLIKPSPSDRPQRPPQDSQTWFVHHFTTGVIPQVSARYVQIRTPNPNSHYINQVLLFRSTSYISYIILRA